MNRGIHMLNQETSKPKNTGATLSRLARYFGPFALALVVVAVLITANTYTQVITPELTGQAVDCFITPATAARVESQSGALQLPGASSATETNCWFNKLDTATATSSDYIAGLGGLVLLVVGLYVAGALMNGVVFYTMSWAAQQVLRRLRVQVFRHIHRLSLSYFNEHEAGSVMSRLTNDMETIQQAVSFALVNVLSGSLLLVWVAVKMLTLSLPYGLISMLVVPFMAGEARKAFRKTRIEIGKVTPTSKRASPGCARCRLSGARRPTSKPSASPTPPTETPTSRRFPTLRRCSPPSRRWATWPWRL